MLKHYEIIVNGLFIWYFCNVATMTEIVGQKLDLFQIKRDTIQHQSSIKLNTKTIIEH